MAIRTATADDVDALVNIAAEAYEIYLPRMDKRPAPMDADFAAHILQDFVLVYDDGKVLAYVVVAEKPDHILLENIAVAKSAQGKGIGRQLIAAVEADLKARGVMEYCLYTNEKMTENLTFYPQLGFVESKRVEEDGYARVYFDKKLHYDSSF